jgi:hypothetical protein
MSKANKVEVQKGPIDPNPTTLRQMTHPQRVADRVEELRMLRGYKTLDLHEPKEGRGK